MQACSFARCSCPRSSHFNPTRPEMWWHSAEAKLLNKKIVLEFTKYLHIYFHNNTLKKYDVKMWNILFNVGYDPVMAFCEHCNETLTSLKKPQKFTD
jgi:tyrosine-protein phosphatase YwqE